ncbi:MAG: hypothetical protein Q9157_005005 [Trypethelium eluteriae]
MERMALSDSPRSPLTSQQTPAHLDDMIYNSSNNSLQNVEKSSSSSDSDDEVPMERFRTGLAAGLQRQAARDGSESEEEMDGKTAYQLMRQRLLGKKQGSLKAQDAAQDTNNIGGAGASASPSNKSLSADLLGPASEADMGDVQAAESSPLPPDNRAKPQTPTIKSAGTSRNSSPKHNRPFHESSSEAEKPRIQSRLQELIAKKRAERLAKEEEQHREEIEDLHEEEISPKPRPGKAKVRRPRVIDAPETDSDEQGYSARKLTQEARPTRKASKKALEEMNRETQRISRNQQLAHSAQTKKKFRKEDLFTRFNFRSVKAGVQENKQSLVVGDSSASALNSAAGSSDMEISKDAETPPSSPPTAPESKSEDRRVEKTTVEPQVDYSYLIQEDSDDNLPSSEIMFSQPRPKIDKGKAPIRGDVDLSRSFDPKPKQQEVQLKAVPIVPPKMSRAFSRQHSDSEDDIEIIDKGLAIFDKMPTIKKTEPSVMRTLKALAHLKSPGKSRAKGKSSMTLTELQALLSRRARDQARKERDERLDELRAKGVYIPTEEEKQKEQLMVENLLEKARQEAQELSKKEKDAAKNDGEDGGDGLPSSDEEYEDERSQASNENEQEKVIELSGSEDDNDDEEDAEEVAEDADDEEGSAAGGDGLLDNEAEDSDGDESMQDDTEELSERQKRASEEASDNEAPIVVHATRMRARKNRVIDDDDEEEEEQALGHEAENLEDPASGDLNLGLVSAPAPLSMTQMFAATMDAEQSQWQGTENGETEQDSMAFLRQLPPPTLPDFDAAMAQSTQDPIVFDSQAETPRKPARENGTKRQTPATAKTAKYAATEYSEVPDPTQDFGFELSRSPRAEEAMPHSTVDTVALTQSPQTKQWERLRRKTDVNAEFSDVDEEEAGQDAQRHDEDEFEISANAFDVMRTAAKKPPVKVFDKKKSDAKDMFEEQAEESEDEYAGLGGASDDESGGEDEEMKKVIDDSDVKLNERELAAFFADKERVRDEKEVEKLYRDIANGGLRKKRGADFELSDSDDDVEARRRRRQREFARQRKALLQDDENLGKIAENPKKAAFLRAVEDHEEEDEVDFFNSPEDDAPVPDSQTSNVGPPLRASETQVPASNETTLKRKRSNDDVLTRPPAQMRRTNQGKKPSNLAEVRETLSFLIDDQQSVPETPISDSEPGNSASENEETPEIMTQPEDDAVFAKPLMKPPKPAPLESRRSSANPIIDRLSLKRSSSSMLSDTESATGLAFHAPNKNSTPGFKVPSLLRRATTTSSVASTHSDSAKSRASAVTEEMGTGAVRRGGSKKSSINYAAREAERRSVVEEAERKRKEGVRKVAGMRRGVLRGLGGGSGGFE